MRKCRFGGNYVCISFIKIEDYLISTVLTSCTVIILDENHNDFENTLTFEIVYQISKNKNFNFDLTLISRTFT